MGNTYLPQPPSWTAQSLELMTTAKAQGWKVTAFKLTEAQRNDLRNYTTQDSMMWGLPVKPRR